MRCERFLSVGGFLHFTEYLLEAGPDSPTLCRHPLGQAHLL
jgi:hypothetical protein